MKADTPLDYAVFQLSPKRSRCELFVSSDGISEKLASGLVKPFVTHLKFAADQVARAVQSIKLEVGKCDNAETWFTKGTLERFVRFVSTPEILESVNTFDAEMSQLEAARKIYSQGTRDQLSGAIGVDAMGATAAADATKKELLRAIDVRLVAVKQDLTTAYARAASAGFNPETVSELQHFADWFGAHRLNEACSKFISVGQRRPDLITPWKPGVNDQVVRSSWGSDMSIDDPTEEQSGPHHLSQNNNKPHNSSGQDQQQQQQSTTQTQTQLHLNQSKPSTCQQPKSTFPCNQDESNNDEKKKEEAVTESSASQPARRLSVQDRIKLFESNQKENSSSGSGGKTIVLGKSAELRRLSSDVSSSSATIPTPTGPVEKAVLRRWSGVSDMSIDLGNDRKESSNIDSPLCTPSSVPQPKSNVFSGLAEDGKDQKDKKELSDSASSVKFEVKSAGDREEDSGMKDLGDGQAKEEVGLKGVNDWKDQVGSKVNQLRSFADRSEQAAVINHGVSQGKLKGFLGSGDKSDRFKGQAGSKETVGLKNQVASQTQSGNFVVRAGNFTSDGEIGNRVEDTEPVDQSVAQSQFRGSHSHSQSLSGQFEGGIGTKVWDTQDKGSESYQSTSQPQWRSFTGDVEETGNNLVSSRKEATKVEDSESQRMKFQKPVTAGPEQVKKMQGRRDESSSDCGNNKATFPGKKVSESQESSGTIQTQSAEEVQRSRQSKGNQELNDQLKLKANELEKLFAEHKLRVPGDQSSLTRRSKPAETQIEQAVSSQYRKPTMPHISPVQLPERGTVVEPSGSSSNMEKFSTPPIKMVDNQDYGNALRRNFSELGLSDESRGKFYERYMQKRDAKLREEWSSKRTEKEAKLKALQDSLERSRAEMKSKFSGFSDRKDSVSSASERAEKLRSFNVRSSMKMEQHPISSIQSEEDEDLSEIFEQKYYGQDRSFSEMSFGDSASRSSQAKKLLPSRNLSSSTPRTAAAPIPRSSTKISNAGSGRRRIQSENPLAQSVPNFSDLRKENTRPSSGVGKVTTRSQARNYARSKSTTEEIQLVEEEKPRRSNSLKKNSGGPVEFSDMLPLNSDGAVLAPLKFDEEQSEQSLHEKYLKRAVSKPFLRKGNGIGPGAGASIAKLKASFAAETLRNEEEYDKLEFEAEDVADMAKEDEEEELETMEVEECNDMDNGKPRLSHESDKVGNSGLENGDSLRSHFQAEPASVAELPASVPSTFHAVGSLQDSPGESPVSWNSRMQHPFSYPHETSDIDASVDSPIGSPASWNFHSLNQTEVDAARMRKKWGSAQKPFLASNPSHNQSRKDMTKGFKRLLKFGRKNRGTESLVDWISAATSDGDDDTEDGRDPGNRSSDDLRKSRMGFVQSHPLDDGYNESELFNEQVQGFNSSIPAPPVNFKLREDHMSGSSMKAPRSFFSLSTFRSKGSDSKLR